MSISNPSANDTELQAANEVLRASRVAALNLLEDAIRARRKAEEAEAAARESEERLQMALAGGRMGMWEWDLRTNRSIWNASEYELLGLPPGDGHIPTEVFFQHVYPDDRETLDRSLAKAMASGTEWADEFRFVRADGQVRWLSAAGRLYRDAEGRPLRMIGVTYDITDRKQAEEALARAKEAAEQASAAKGQFLANISHELRTPMNAILGMLDVALPKAVDPIVKDCLLTARGSADLLLTLLNDLLDTSKIEAGKLELEAAPFSLRRVLDQITRVLSVRASEKGLSFCCRIPDQTPDGLLGDRTRLQQVLLNLAGNAIKFTQRGKVEVGVRTLSQDREACLEFTVRDTGIGIPEADLKRIFDPFSQADASTTRRFGGTGLGLSISRTLVSMMGGAIWAESEVGKGSTFYFTIGLPQVAEVPAEPESSFDLTTAAPSTRRLLLAEDNPANQKLATYILRGRGHTVDVAGDGEQAILMAKRDRYDVILMDVQMPGMDGMEATAAIRAHEGYGKHVPIIAMTAHAMKGDRERCLAAGMDGYLAKPINGPQMVALVESFADQSPQAIETASDSAETLPPPTAAFVQQSHVASPPSTHETSPNAAPAMTLADPEIFNLDEAIRLCFRRPDMFQRMVEVLFKETDSLFPEMRAALEQGDIAQVGHLGHRLKGTLVYLSAKRATEAALRVEQFARNPGQPAEVEEAIQALHQQCEILKSALAPHRTAAPGPKAD